MAPNPPSGFLFLAPKKKKNRLIAGYVAPGRLSLWLEDRNDILMPSSPPPPAFTTSPSPKRHSRGFDRGGYLVYSYSSPQRTLTVKPFRVTSVKFFLMISLPEQT